MPVLHRLQYIHKLYLSKELYWRATCKEACGHPSQHVRLLSYLLTRLPFPLNVIDSGADQGIDYAV